MIRRIGLSFPLLRTFFLFLCVLCGACSVACGRKGPPLAPIVYLPRAVTEFAAKRVENEVVVQFTVPTLNTDGSGPADLRRVEVYAHTGPLPATTDFPKYGTLVASVEIANPEKPKDETQPATDEAKADAPDAADAKPPANTGAGAGSSDQASQVGLKMTEQGWLISVREPLTDKERETGPMPPVRAAPPPAPNAPVVEKLETPGTENFDLAPTRFYTAVGVSRSRGRRGPYAGPLRVPLVEPLMPPSEIAVGYTETTISLTWPRQPEDAALPAVTAAPAGATPGGAPPAPVSPAPLSPASSSAPVPAPAADAPPVAVPPAVAVPPPVAAPPPVPTPPARAPVVPPVAMQETAGTYEVYADLETEDTRDVAPPAPPATAGAKPSPAAAAIAAAAKAAAAGPAPRYGYNVYDAPRASASAPASQIATADKPNAPIAPNAPVAPSAPPAPNAPRSPVLPLNKTLLTAPTFADARIEFDVERCYVIRRVELSGGVAIEGVASAPVCVTPRDAFAPAAPKNVQAISGGAGVSLLWDANTEADFGGYLVLRGEAPGDKLSPLTKSPITETSFNDTTVRRGRTYVYEVVAVDKQTPANRSAPSNRVEETIR